ncbi:MAG: uroporphyrinogen-III synthase [Verrucomicrobia bacterium]|nr:uroporphyrinogen-III synthase [Prolixibacteraceae bacterium]
MKTPVFFIAERLSKATRQWLQKQQVQFIEKPFSRVEYKKPNLKFFETMAQSPKQWIVTSTYAAHWLVRFGSKIGLTPNDRLYCWSDRQAEVLSQLNLPVGVASYSNSSELASKVIDENRGESAIFLHGDKLHNDISAVLARYFIPYSEVEVYRNTPVEQMVSGMFDAYLFFSPAGIDSFKASGNFPNPQSVVLANENSTAREAWRLFTNTVYLSPEKEELSFVQYALNRWRKEHEE